MCGPFNVNSSIRTCFLMKLIPLQTIKIFGKPHKPEGVCSLMSRRILSNHRSITREFLEFILHRVFNSMLYPGSTTTCSHKIPNVVRCTGQEK